MPSTSLRRSALALALACALPQTAAAAPFVYQGSLTDGGRPANGRYDLQLQLYRSERGLDPIVAPITVPDVEVRNGSFRVEAEIAAPAGAERAYASVGVRESGGGAKAFSVLPGREPVALATAAIGTCWSSTGDAGSNPATNFLGTTDAQPLDLRVNNLRAVRYQPTTVSPNVIAGWGENEVFAGVRGATIAGGGSQFNLDPAQPDARINYVTDHFGSVGGGASNVAGNDASGVTSEPFATVAGGLANQASGAYSTVAGGNVNLATTLYASVAGGSNNLASGFGSFIGGGASNLAPGGYAATVGGYLNIAGGEYSFAGGRRGVVRDKVAAGESGCSGGQTCGDEGTFLWADATDADFLSTGPNQFLVRASGGVGINSNTIPGATDLVIKGRNGSNADLYLQSGAGSIGYNFGVDGNDAATSDLFISRYNGSAYTDLARFNANTGTFQVFVNTPISPAGGAWAAASDARLKHDIEPLSGALDKMLALEGVTFEYNADVPAGYGLPGRRTGFVAQQVETVFPDWISRDAQGFRLVAPKGFEALTVEALRELEARAGRRATELERELARERAAREDLERRVAALAAEIGR